MFVINIQDAIKKKRENFVFRSKYLCFGYGCFGVREEKNADVY